MADIKISDLTEATSATANQQIEVNDGGVSRKITVDQVKTYVGAQPADNTLTALAGITTAADRVPYFTGTDVATTTTLTSFGRSLIDDVSSSEARTTLGLVIGTNVQAFDANTAKTNVANSFTAEQTVKSVKETVFTITDGTSVDINPTNGAVQLWTLGDSRTPTATNFADGQSVTLMIDDGSAFTITWTSIAPVWKTNGGVAPTLNLTGFTAIVLWKVGSTVYGARVGDA
jgi:hypothetical protein